MSTQTTNLKLVKPDVNDFYDINIHNNNMDIIDNYNTLRHPPQWLRSGTIEEYIIEKFNAGWSGGVILIADTIHTPSDLPTRSTWIVVEWGRQPSAWIHLTAYVDGSEEIYHKQFVALSDDGRRTEWVKITTSYEFNNVKEISNRVAQYFDSHWVCQNTWSVGFFVEGCGVMIQLPTTKTSLENMKIEALCNNVWITLNNIEITRFMGNLIIIGEGLPESEVGKCFLVRLNGTVK